jgi:hypothetical protein
VGFDGQVEDLLKVRVVEMGEDAEEVLVYVFGGVGEGLGKLAACRGRMTKPGRAGSKYTE